MITYTDLLFYDTYEERLEFLRFDVKPSELTFGMLRQLNQKFYNTRTWRRIRDQVIARDLGYDLAVPGRQIFGKVIVHHINPITPKDLYHNSELVLDPENLVTVSHDTHLGIHFGFDVPKVDFVIERVKGDTKLW